jgi:hypothetical protein
VTKTAFITLCSKNLAREPLPRWLARVLSSWLAVALLCLASGLAWAQPPAQVEPLTLQRQEDGWFLATQLTFELPQAVEEALGRGIPFFFMAEVEVLKERWYWADKLITRQERYWRLSYHPLTRRWRLLASSNPIGNSGLGVNLGQNFDSLSEALAAIQRVSRWRIANLAEIDMEAKHRADFRFRLDLTQLPRPLQIGALGEADWALSLSRSQRMTPELPPVK